MKIAITGSTGHIGTNMVLGLLERGHEIFAIYRNKSKTKFIDHQGITLVEGSLFDSNFLRNIFSKVEVVIHLAGIISLQGDPDGEVMRINVEGTRQVVTACLKSSVKRLIHFSSIQAFHFKKTDLFVDENHPPADTTCFKYNQSKALAEQVVLQGVAQGLNAIILNPTAVIGAHDYWESSAGRMFRQIFQGKLPALVKEGFDWVDVRDIVNATDAALRTGRAGERYILSGHWASAKTIAKLCEQVSKQKKIRIYLPIELAFLGLPFIQLFSKLTRSPALFTYESLMVLKNSHQHISHAKATQVLNYHPRPLPETIQHIYEWLKKEGRV